MSWTHLEDRRCRARKPHRCMVCDEAIKVGEEQVSRAGIDADGPMRFWMHVECEKFSSKWDNDDWESGVPGGITRAEINALLTEKEGA